MVIPGTLLSYLALLRHQTRHADGGSRERDSNFPLSRVVVPRAAAVVVDPPLLAEAQAHRVVDHGRDDLGRERARDDRRGARAGH